MTHRLYDLHLKINDPISRNIRKLFEQLEWLIFLSEKAKRSPANSNDEISPLLDDCSEIFSFGITTIGDVDFSRLNGTMGQTFGSMLIRDSNVSKCTAC